MLEFFSGCFKLRRQTQQRQPHPPHSWASTHSAVSSAVEEVHAVSSRSGRHFSLQDLRIASRNFHPDNLLGKGGFGGVYKGVLADGTEVAIKQLSHVSHQGKSEFINEVHLLSTVQHVNLVRLFGCCAEESEKLLVYEYLKNGSLHEALFEGGLTSLEWSLRRKIIMGAARGLKYLHEDSRVRIIHRDIKASNILLDDNFRPKIADFGLAKLFDKEQTHASTRVAGTFGYLAPEYAVNGKLTEKADVYSFGVVMLEVVSGRKHTNFDLESRDQRLLEVAWKLYTEQKLLDLMDCRMGDRYVPDEAARIVHVALLCTQAAPDLRPSMSRIVYLLSGRSPISEQPTKPPFIFTEGSSMEPRQHRSAEGSSIGMSGSSTMASISSFFSH